jgi:hypothetical protein
VLVDAPGSHAHRQKYGWLTSWLGGLRCIPIQNATHVQNEQGPDPDRSKSPPLPPCSDDRHEPLNRLCPSLCLCYSGYKHMALAALAPCRWMRCKCISPIVAAQPESTSASRHQGPAKRVMHGIRAGTRHHWPVRCMPSMPYHSSKAPLPVVTNSQRGIWEGGHGNLGMHLLVCWFYIGRGTGGVQGWPPFQIFSAYLASRIFFFGLAGIATFSVVSISVRR